MFSNMITRVSFRIFGKGGKCSVEAEDDGHVSNVGKTVSQHLGARKNVSQLFGSGKNCF